MPHSALASLLAISLLAVLGCDTSEDSKPDMYKPQPSGEQIAKNAAEPANAVAGEVDPSNVRMLALDPTKPDEIAAAAAAVADANVKEKTANCAAGECTQLCTLGDCKQSCSGGDCTQTCQGDTTCRFACSGGGCTQTCRSGSSCTLSCSGGGCTQTCDPGTAQCKKSCSGDECKN